MHPHSVRYAKHCNGVLIPSRYPPRGQVRQAWIVAATFIPVSFGWAAGDVSLAAYIQASLARVESETEDVSALGAVMAFLYSTYIVIYAIANPLLGQYVDSVWNGSGQTDVRPAVYNIAGVQLTVLCIVVILATFVPKGAFSLNPRALYGENLDAEVAELVPEDGKDLKKEKGLEAASAEEVEGEDSLRRGSVMVGFEDAAVVAMQRAGDVGERNH